MGPMPISTALVLAAMSLAAGVFAVLGVTFHDRPVEVHSVFVGVAAACLALAWARFGQRAVGILTAELIGLMLAAKPWLHPIRGHELSGLRYELSPTAERHLYPLFAGLALLVIAAALVKTARPRR